MTKHQERQQQENRHEATVALKIGRRTASVGTN